MHTNIALLFVKYNYNLYQIKYSLIFINYLSNVTNMNGMFVRAYAFNQDQMNGIVEETYEKIINECERLKKNTRNIRKNRK